WSDADPRCVPERHNGRAAADRALFVSAVLSDGGQGVQRSGVSSDAERCRTDHRWADSEYSGALCRPHRNQAV
ncbi:uncharacterized protein METZ01_LOCUS107605, partial [marine metagenome]